jgi:hypothetical protein
MLKKFILIFLSAIVGALFIFSAYSKLVDIDPFEWTIAETNLFSFKIANLVARLIIALEFFLGFCFIFSWHNQQRIFKWSAYLLILFNIYLLYVLATYGNNLNCGCFGKMIYMTPMQAYLKNILLLLIIYVLSKYNFTFFKKHNLLYYLLSLASILAICFYTPPEFIYVDLAQKFKPYAANTLDKMYISEKTALPFDYKKGKNIISVMSMHCPFCKKAARKMSSMQKNDANLPFYNLYAGDSTSVKQFLKETNAANIPYQITKQADVLFELSKGSLPAILWIKDGMVVKSSNYIELETKDIQNWIKEK